VIWVKYVWAVIAVTVGVRWIIQRKVEVGIEGRTPALIVTGTKAIALGAIALLIGLLALLM
jgi:hypothetical protein